MRIVALCVLGVHLVYGTGCPNMLSNADASKVGSRVDVRLGEGDSATHQMVTRSTDPSVFTVENFLTEEETAWVTAAMRKNMHRLESSSTMTDDIDPNDYTVFAHVDQNRDRIASQRELLAQFSRAWDAGSMTDQAPNVKMPSKYAFNVNILRA